MRTVWKFVLGITDEQEIEMPRSAYLLHVDEIGDSRHLGLWAMVDTEAERAQRTIVIHGTGHPSLETVAQYVGTVVTLNAQLVWHVFDGGEKL